MKPYGSVGEMVDLSSNAALAIDEKLRVCAWNDCAERLLGYSPNEVIGRPCGDVIRAMRSHNVPLCVPDCEIGKCFQRHQPFDVGRCFVRHKEGRLVPVHIGSMIVGAGARSQSENDGLAIVFFTPRSGNVVAEKQPCLRVQTFGRFSVTYGDRILEIEKWQRKQALALLKCLITHSGRPVPREYLIDWLWPEVDEIVGVGRLKVVVYYLRQQFRDAGVEADVVDTVGKGYALRLESIWLDKDAFEGHVTQGFSHERQGRPLEAIKCFEMASALYRGDYLEEDPYAEWCMEERERLREVYLEALAHLADLLMNSGEHDKAVQVCRTALARESCRENFHRTLMKSLGQLGSTDQAVAQFYRCREILSRELDVEPTFETERVYQGILGAAAEGLL
jgi:PAS domain S-box-containing protein